MESQEDAIKFFRKFVAEKEGISEEEAGASINTSVQTGLELMEPVSELRGVIAKNGVENPTKGLKILLVIIQSLVSGLPEEAIDWVFDSIKRNRRKIDQELQDMERKIGEYAKNERGVK